MTQMAVVAPRRPIRLRAAEGARLLALLLPLGLLAAALGSQYIGGLAPCEMCHWQRWAHGAAIPFAALAFAGPAGAPRTRLLTLIAAAAIAVSGAIGVYHAGVELGWFEGFTTCTASGAMTLEDIMKVPLVRCDQVQWAFLGVSMAGWNAILSLGGAALVVLMAIRGRGR